jgi:pyrroloquinoline quinone biosynthesis protein B
VLGLIAMREGSRLQVHATPAVRLALSQAWPLEGLLQSFCGIKWHDLDGAPVRLDGSLELRPIFLLGDPPPFARDRPMAPAGHSIACEIHDRATGKHAVIAPDVGCVTPELQTALERADAVLFDGTFWSDDELRPLKSSARSAREMGHLPIHDGSLDLLRSLKASLKSYLHINNTNPILDPASPERAMMEAAGIRAEEDGTEWTL